MVSYAELTPHLAKKESPEFLIQVLNNCKPESGAYLAARDELLFRTSARFHKQKLRYGVIGGAIGSALTVIAFLIKHFLVG